MKCIQMREHITLYLSDDLSSDHIIDLHAHLETCDACQNYQREMREMMDDMQQLNSLEMPSDLLSGIQEAILPELVAGSKKHWEAWKSYSLAAVALVLIVLGVLIPKGIETPALPEVKIAEEIVDETQPMEDLTLASTAPNEESSVIVKLYTNDPDVVIYWFGD